MHDLQKLRLGLIQGYIGGISALWENLALYRVSGRLLENHIEKNMEDEMEAGITLGLKKCRIPGRRGLGLRVLGSALTGQCSAAVEHKSGTNSR